MRPSVGTCVSVASVVLMMHACQPVSGPQAGEAAIRQVMAEQEAAWDRGDIRGYMAGYAEEVCFIGSRGRTCGREAVARNYGKSYPDKAAMGDLRFVLHEVLPVGGAHAWVTGTWELFRTADTLSGGFSLLWHKGADGWQILRDHSY